MTTKERDKILEGAKEVFFAAMLDGYAGGENRKSVKTLFHNGYTKKVAFCDPENHNGYVVIDEWHTNPDSDRSAGTTLITFLGDPVWWMSYDGEYLEGAIEFLKRALKKAYERKLFLGGRGLASVLSERFSLNGLTFKLGYKNVWDGDFQSFSGTEKIFQHPLAGYDPEPIGYHRYCGQALI